MFEGTRSCNGVNKIYKGEEKTWFFLEGTIISKYDGRQIREGKKLMEEESRYMDDEDTQYDLSRLPEVKIHDDWDPRF